MSAQCKCHLGSAAHCTIHTQADFDAQDRLRSPAERLLALPVEQQRQLALRAMDYVSYMECTLAEKWLAEAEAEVSAQ